MHTELLGQGVQIFIVGFGGVFVNLLLLMAILKVLGKVAPGLEARSKKDKT